MPTCSFMTKRGRVTFETATKSKCKPKATTNTHKLKTDYRHKKKKAEAAPKKKAAPAPKKKAAPTTLPQTTNTEMQDERALRAARRAARRG